MNKLVIISAPSGAGKTTLCQRLLNDLKDTLVLSVSSTTRPPRGQETDGIDYHFLSPDVFKRETEAGDFAEWALVHGHYYGTSKKTVESAFHDGKSVLLDIDVQGAESLSRAFPKQNVRIFIAPPSLAELEKRLRARGTDTEDTIQRRLYNARGEMAHQKDFDHVIINDDFERTYSELKKVVQKELRG